MCALWQKRILSVEEVPIFEETHVLRRKNKRCENKFNYESTRFGDNEV